MSFFFEFYLHNCFFRMTTLPLHQFLLDRKQRWKLQKNNRCDVFNQIELAYYYNYPTSQDRILQVNGNIHCIFYFNVLSKSVCIVYILFYFLLHTHKFVLCGGLQMWIDKKYLRHPESVTRRGWSEIELLLFLQIF